MPRDSNTSTQPRYFTGKVHVPTRTAASSACHWWGRADSGGEPPLRLRKDSRNERRRRSMPARGGDKAAPARARRKELRTDDFWNVCIEISLFSSDTTPRCGESLKLYLTRVLLTWAMSDYEVLSGWRKSVVDVNVDISFENNCDACPFSTSRFSQ